MKFEHEVKVGVFILASLAMLIYVILWLHKFDMSSYLSIAARFRDVGTLSIGSNVLYRGVKAGTIYDITISHDGEYALVKINITNKRIRLYEGSIATIVDKGFTGTKALTITPPKNIQSKKCLKNGAIIEGKRSFTLDQLQKTLTNLSEEITVEDIVRDIHQLLKSTNNFTTKLDRLLSNSEKFMNEESIQKWDSFLTEATTLSRNLNLTSRQLNKILTDPKVASDIKESLASTNKAMQQFSKVADKTDKLIDKSNKAVEKLDKTISKTNQTLNDPELHGSLRDSMKKMTDILTDIKEITGDQEVRENLKSTLKDSSESLSRLNCFSKELSSTLSKRFLLPRMILGKPGKSMSTCTTLDNYDIIENKKSGNNDE